MNVKKIRSVVAGLALPCLLLGASVAAVGLWRLTPAGEPAAAAAAQTGPDQSPVEVIRVTLRPTGFDPATMTAPKGRALIAVDDLSGLDGVTLRLDRAAGGRLREVKAERGGAKLREVLDLHPGEYVLSLEERPDWACRINVATN
jgi:hypothetical protein